MFAGTKGSAGLESSLSLTSLSYRYALSFQVLMHGRENLSSTDCRRSTHPVGCPQLSSCLTAARPFLEAPLASATNPEPGSFKASFISLESMNRVYYER